MAATDPDALFQALLRGDTEGALCLLEAGAAPGGSPPELLFPVGGFTALHAAAIGGCAAAIPVLAAAGLDVNASLMDPFGFGEPLGDSSSEDEDPPLVLWELLEDCGHDPEDMEEVVVDGTTALALAVR